MEVSGLVAAQNRDGGWPYGRGSSRIEPTVFALLAISREREGANVRAAGRGLGWLRMHQRPDGGWAPAPSVIESTWVTALPLLLAPEQLGAEARARAARWLSGQTGADATFRRRLRQRFGGPRAEPFQAWPWFPGTAAWVAPTAFAILALRSIDPAHPRIAAGCRFLLARRCADGGWNYGAARSFDCDAPSYPETTGLVLLALERSASLEPSLKLAQRQLSQARSAEALAWLYMALRAHGRDPGPWHGDRVRPRTWYDAALCLMAAGGYGAVTRTAS